MDKIFTLSLTELEIRAIASALVKAPYEAVAPLLQNIQTQVDAQADVDPTRAPDREAEIDKAEVKTKTSKAKAVKRA